jgi:acyl-CoA dehydrogenase
MSVILLLGIIAVLFCVLALNKASLWIWAAFAALAAYTFVILFDSGFFTQLILFVPVFALAALSIPFIRRKFVARPLYEGLRRTFPSISDTEREALAAGTVGWDAELFSGTPNWAQLKSIPPVHLSPEERDFLDGPTEELCAMIDEWDMRHTRRDVSPEVWDFIKDKGFWGMLISKEHGGLGFSAQAQSLILGKIASRSPDAAIITMVPNSLGPGELVEKYGTDEQKKFYLPRLAKGQEVPCFALTSPNAGSDAASMRDVGFVCEQAFEGKKTLGVSITWNKRYITLAPKATVLGLAFNLLDPDNLLEKDKEDIGITLALIPTSHEGVVIGNRHLPGGALFPNGPTSGTDVFIPLEWIIGGSEMAGRGWGMLMECLAVGRAISLPATSTSAIKSVFRTTSAYARLRRQFSIPISKMEGIEEPLTRIIENAYVVEAGRAMTAAMVGAGQKPSVISALLKYSSTERMRQSITDAMDIHGGRAICDGPSNYLQAAYQSVPVGITVEGANILTRTLITFAQGALRCHPYLFKETEALQDKNHERGFRDFEEAFYSHISWSMANAVASTLHNLSDSRFAKGPGHAPEIEQWYRELSRASRSFAFMADMTVGLLAGGLKTKQKITGRMADALSELYLLSAVLKRFEDDGEPKSDIILVELCARNSLHRFDVALQGVIDNFPIRWAAYVMKLVAQPLGIRSKPASDRLGKKVVALAIQPGEVRDRLTSEIYINDDPDDPTGILEYTLKRAVSLERAEKAIEKAARSGKIHRHYKSDWFKEAVEKKIVTQQEADDLRELDELVGRVIAVDEFPPDEVIPHFKTGPDKTDTGKAGENKMAGAKKDKSKKVAAE